ncbi:integrin alpha-D-like isoform X2 [Acipenser ruthenus]|uniref:integrin alpha-D-like isoform X2 n=1 Tax=Acipenser ruthenus TaxID=7906 RepID=UPI0027424ECD|nr:integrin alpha-D-like isoform X2 [Acipenser ruthenus]
MLSILTILLHICSSASSFNINSQLPPLPGDSSTQFGHKVLQFGSGNRTRIIVSAPLKDNGTGGLYSCQYSSQDCAAINLHGQAGISLGLSMATDTHNADHLVACGPRLSHYCDRNSFLNGVCFLLNENLNVSETLKPAFQECTDSGLDALILFDDSVSITSKDFNTMNTFIKNTIRMFTDPKAQVAAAQFSTVTRPVFQFENFRYNRNPDVLMQHVQQTRGNTYTPSAIKYVLDEMFTEVKGMRRESKKLLIVITDGLSNDKLTFQDVIPLAEKRGIIRYAIGVGSDFKTSLKELQAIASDGNVFNADSFDALSSIQEQLKERIFAIEGTNKRSNFSSFQMELSQGGFSAAFAEGALLLGAVGSFDWSGGMVEVRDGQSTFINASSQDPDMKTSYLGYSVAAGRTGQGVLYFLGAPRYRHKGKVIVFQKRNSNWVETQHIQGEQIGSAFGSELCSVDVNADGQTDLLLIGAPLFHQEGVGGRVTVCVLEPAGNVSCNSSLYGSHGNLLGRFGAAIARTADLNGDNLSDIAIGAPLENDWHGSVYIFIGERRGVRSGYSQKLEGMSFSPSLQFFGQSVHAAGDVTGDGMTDIAVGAKGAVVILRSQPVVNVSVSVSFSPAVLPQERFHCAGSPSSYTDPAALATVCVSVEPLYAGVFGSLSMSVNISLELDPGRASSRLLFSNTAGEVSQSLSVKDRECVVQEIRVPDCIEDYSPVGVRGSFSVSGEEIQGSRGLRPILTPDCNTEFTGQLPLEKICGEDDICVADLSVSFNFSGSRFIVASSSFVLNVIVNLTNAGEDSNSSEVVLLYPAALSFTKAIVVQSTWRVSLACTAVRIPGKAVLERTSCEVSAPILKEGATVLLLASFAVSRPDDLKDSLEINVTARSKNENLTLEDNFARDSIPVLQPINVIVRGAESTQYLNFTGSLQESKLAEHSYEVRNLAKAAPVNMTFIVPLELEHGFKWNISIPQACVNEGEVKGNSNQTDYQHERISTAKGCQGTLCRVIHCAIDQLTKEQPIRFTFSGNVIKDKTQREVKLKLESWGFLSYNQQKYTQYPDGKYHQAQVVTDLEVLVEVNYVPIILGSTLGGLFILLLIFVILFKAGFFKRDSSEPLTTNEQES